MSEKLIFNQYEYTLGKILPPSPGVGSTIQTTISELSDTKTYEFIVLSYNSLGSTISQGIFADTQAPINPNLFKGSNIDFDWNVLPISSNGLRVIWNDSFIEELVYEMYVSTDNENYDFVTKVSEYANSYDIENLILGNSYYVLINSFIGTGADKGQLFFTSLTGPVQVVEIPKPPINFQYTYFDSDEVTLSWDYQDEIFKTTKIFYSTDGLTYSFIYDASEEESSKVTITGLTPGTDWWFKVRTGNPYGDSDFAGPVRIATLPNPPKSPTGLTGVPGISAFIKLNWTSGATNETGFKIFRSDDAITYAEIQSLTRDYTSYVDVDRTENTHYYYKMNSFNEGGTSAFSNIVGITASSLPATVPASPTGITASVFYNTINISWTDQATNEFGYKIYVKQG